MQDRYDLAIDMARTGGDLAMQYFARLETLKIEDKGVQDFVSEADRAVEDHIRSRIADSFPDDGIVGEEGDNRAARSGCTWVIDPIDGTANFVSGIPAWTVVLAVVHEDRTQVGVIFDPVHGELYQARLGHGAVMGERKLRCPPDRSFSRGSIGVGASRRTPYAQTIRATDDIMARDGVFYRNASGALSLAYVSAGRLNGYIEGHMNAWDCLAGQLLVAEAGGRIEAQSADNMLAHGGRVVAGSAGVFDTLVAIADSRFRN